MIVDVGDRRSARRPVRMEVAARDAPRVRRRRLPERDGDHQRSLPAGIDPGRLGRADAAAAIRCPIPKTSASGRPDGAGSTTSSRSCGSSRPVAAQPLGRGDAGRRAGVRARSAARPATCRRSRPAQARTRSSTAGPVPLFSDLLLHDVGTGDGIKQASARARGNPDAGAVGAAAAAAAAARRQRRDDHRRDRAPPERSRSRAPRLRVALRGRAESPDRFPSIDLIRIRGSRFRVQGSGFAVHMVPRFTWFRVHLQPGQGTLNLNLNLEP